MLLCLALLACGLCFVFLCFGAPAGSTCRIRISGVRGTMGMYRFVSMPSWVHHRVCSAPIRPPICSLCCCGSSPAPCSSSTSRRLCVAFLRVLFVFCAGPHGLCFVFSCFGSPPSNAQHGGNDSTTSHSMVGQTLGLRLAELTVECQPPRTQELTRTTHKLYKRRSARLQAFKPRAASREL